MGGIVLTLLEQQKILINTIIRKGEGMGIEGVEDLAGNTEPTGEESPAEEAPVEESPAEEAPVEESPAEEAPVEE